MGVENCPLPLTKPVAVNTGLALKSRVRNGVRVRVREVEPKVRVHPGVAAAAVQGLHDLVFAHPGADYNQTTNSLILTSVVFGGLISMVGRA